MIQHRRSNLLVYFMHKLNRGRKIFAEITNLYHFKRVDECSEDSFIVRDSFFKYEPSVFSNLTRKQKCSLKVFTSVPFCYNHDL